MCALTLHLNHYSRPKNYLEPILMNRDLVDQPPDQLFIIFLDDRRLLPEEDAHFGVPFAQVVPTGVFNLGLLFFIAQSVNLISDLLDVGMSAGQLQKLDLHVLDLFLDFFDCCIVFPAEHSCDVVLQSGQKRVPAFQCGVDRLNQSLLDFTFQDHAGIAEQACIL